MRPSTVLTATLGTTNNEMYAMLFQKLKHYVGISEPGYTVNLIPLSGDTEFGQELAKSDEVFQSPPNSTTGLAIHWEPEHAQKLIDAKEVLQSLDFHPMRYE